MTPKEVHEYISSFSFSWIMFIFGGLFVLAAIDRGNYVAEAFVTFVYGAVSVYIEQIEVDNGVRLVWTKRVLLLLWILLIASRYLSLFQPLNLWAH